jgi:protease-4
MGETSVMGKPASPQPQSTGTTKRRIWPWVVVGVAVLGIGWCVVAFVIVGLLSGPASRESTFGFGDAVGVVYIEGEIGVSSSGTVSGVNSERIVGYVRQAEANRRIKAIVVYINSPGGTVVPSDEMYRALRDATKPVVVAMGEIAASGGYYIACGADKIYAHPATITGSIGVYGTLINAAELLDRLGVEGIVIRSGDAKAIGNWFEHPTEEQLAIEKEIVEELHAMFVEVVAEGRDMEIERVRQLADGRPFTGQQALDLELVDALGTLSDAIDDAATMGGISGRPEIIEYRRAPSFLELWLGSRAREGDLAVLEWIDGRFALPQMRYVRP